MRLIRRSLPIFCLVLLGACAGRGEAPRGWTADEMRAELAFSGRSGADRARDDARKPAEVVAFMGVRPGMTVLDVMAAGGWYTEVFAVAVGPAGRVVAENPAWLLEARNGASSKALAARLADNRLPNVTRADGGLEKNMIRPGSVDIAFTALNFHDVYYRDGEDAALQLLEQVKMALRPGGIFTIIDHHGDPGQPNDKLHRIHKDIVIDLATRAGYTLAGEGDMLAHPEDARDKMVFMPGVRGNTDRFVLNFRKS